MSCDPQWLADDECDCGCQFADNSDCGSNCTCGSACKWCWCNTTAQNACPSAWNGDGECDCACQFADVDCPGTTPTGACCYANGSCSVTTSVACCGGGGTYRGNNTTCAQADCPGPTPTGACCFGNGDCTLVSSTSCASAGGAYQGNGTNCAQLSCRDRCAPICDYCWEGTSYAGSCDPAWEGDGQCDCGCQFTDPDCGPKGACCAPANGVCASLTATTCRSYLFGVFHGVGVACAQVDCLRCDPGCQWCWVDTLIEHDCPSSWAADAECDCGCQFADSICAVGVCGNLVCEEDATSCRYDCKDLRAFGDFQNCFNPGQSTPEACVSHVYAAPAGIGLEDYAVFARLLSGP
ncbi:MAG: hypothetical protein V1790_02935 [Planctomycetota bacterium]